MKPSTAQSTGPLASGSTTVIANGKGLLNHIQVVSDGTNAATVTVYDNTAASGKIIAQLSVSGAGLQRDIVFYYAVRCDIGMTVTVTGTGAVGYVGFGG